jgi:hypothetical protein
LGNRSSFAWRRLWQSRDLLSKGLIWRVGSGANVRIWGDRWIQSTPTHMIQDPIQILPMIAKVEEYSPYQADFFTSNCGKHLLHGYMSTSVAGPVGMGRNIYEFFVGE